MKINKQETRFGSYKIEYLVYDHEFENLRLWHVCLVDYIGHKSS